MDSSQPTNPDEGNTIEPSHGFAAQGASIGPYKLLQKIGEGGFGVVYMAEQTAPVTRRVALKIIKLGMDTKQVIARFEAERQALAMMDHPNIAKVLDAGATDSGRPYFVMELVRGVPVTEYCDKNHLPARARLELFMLVCQAIQHAHQKGIIHRDIKPSNVLVTLHDGKPIPMVIDFGIAKATNQKLTEKTLFTNYASMIGTPAYMSPEQAEMSQLDIDTRSDIYSLGVLLYELLTGTTPFSEKRLRSASYGEMQRIIAEEEPERPSTRLAKTTSAAVKDVTSKKSAIRSPQSAIDPDLDWIVMKCLEKDRTRRYETANGLGMDIMRHLDNETVSARPPTAGYRIQKVLRRHKGAVLASVAVLLTLTAGLMLSTVALLRERRARLEAAEAYRAREQARRVTEAETVRADSVARFVVDFFEAALPSLEQQGHSEAIHELLRVADGLAGTLSNAPLAEATTRLEIGNGYNNDQTKDLAAAQIQYRIAERRAGDAGRAGKHQQTLARVRLLHSSMWTLQQQNAPKDKELIDFGRACLTQTPPDSEAAAEALADAALFKAYFGTSAEAETLAREALEAAPDDAAHRFSRIVALDVLASETSKHGATNEALFYGRKFLGIAMQLESDELRTRDFQRFSAMLSFLGQYRPPKELLEETLRSLKRDDTPVAVILKGNLGIAIACSGDWRGGLNLLCSGVTNRASVVHLWMEAVCLSGLVRDEDLRRTLCAYGLAQFAAGAEPDVSRILAEGILLGPTENSLLPVIRQLVNRSSAGPAWTQSGARIPLALLEYRSGNHQQALRLIESFLRDHASDTRSLYREVYGLGQYLRSATQAKLGQTAAALESYRAGEKLHSAALRTMGTPYQDQPTGGGFASQHATELMRREAALLLGEAALRLAPTDY